MTVTPLRLQTQTLTNAAVVQYTAPANTRVVIKRLTITSIAAGATTANLWITPSGGAAVMINNGLSVASGATTTLNEWSNVVLEPGDAITAQASANTSLNINISGYKVV